MTEAPGQSRGGSTARDDQAPVSEAGASDRVESSTDRHPASAGPAGPGAAGARPAGSSAAGAAGTSARPAGSSAAGASPVGAAVQTAPSYGTASFGPGTSAPSLPTTDGSPESTRAASVTPPAAPLAAGAHDPAAATAPASPDPGARDWRDQWRAASGAGDDGTGTDDGTAAPTSSTKGVNGAPPAARGGGFKAALTAGLAQAKAVAAGTLHTPSAPGAGDSTMLGLGADDAAPAPGGVGVGAAAAGPVLSGSVASGTVAAGAVGAGSAAVGSAAAAGVAAGSSGGRQTAGTKPTGPDLRGAERAGAARAARDATTVSSRPPVGPPSGAVAVGATPSRPPVPAASSMAQGKKPRGVAARVRRAHLKLTRIDPWTVMKVSFMLSIAFGIMTMVAVAVVWSMLDAAGVFSSLNDTVQSVTGQGGGALGFDLMSWVGFDRVMGFATLIAVVDVVLITALATLAAFLYNLAASLLGGVEVTFVEDHP